MWRSFSSYRIRTEYLRQYSLSGPVFITFLIVGDKIPDRSNFWKKGSVLADWFYANLAEAGVILEEGTSVDKVPPMR